MILISTVPRYFARHIFRIMAHSQEMLFRIITKQKLRIGLYKFESNALPDDGRGGFITVAL